jgi:hypothetical protein
LCYNNNAVMMMMMMMMVMTVTQYHMKDCNWMAKIQNLFVYI